MHTISCLSRAHRSRTRTRRWLVVAALFGLGISGCKIVEDGPPSPPPAQEEAGPDGACGTFARRVCASTGERSRTCLAVRDTAGILTDAACTVALRDLELSLGKLAQQRAPCDQLVSKLCADLGSDTDSCRMVTARTPELPVSACQEMLGHYDGILADFRKQEALNAPLDAATQAEIAGAGAPAFGPEDAQVTVVVFSDFQCPFCARSAKVTDALKETYGDRVRLVFRQFPLNMHPEAHLAAQAALAAHAQGKFWPYHDLLFANQDSLDRASLEKYGAEVGLDMGAFRAALDQGTYKDRVDHDLALGEKVSVQGTPTLFVAGRRVGNPGDPEMVAAAIDAALGRGRASP